MAKLRPVQNGKIPIRGVIFDYGNVLCHPQQPSDLEAMAQVCGIAVPRFRELYWKFRVPYDRADLSAETYWQCVAREQSMVFSAEQIAELVSLDTQGWARLNMKTVGWAEQLHESGLRLGLLSNMPSDLSRYLVARGGWVEFFDHLTFSCEVRLVKPDPAIYQACLSPLGLAPQEVLFLDDLTHNVEAAAKLGIQAQLFDTLEQTVVRLEPHFELPFPEAPRNSVQVSMKD